jgi:hypothetical protein
MARSGGAPAACGHGTDNGTTSLGRCWDCHLAHLRANGDPDRADRLEEAKRLHDEGRFDMAALEAGMVGVLIDEYGRTYDDPVDDAVPRGARRLRDGRPERNGR